MTLAEHTTVTALSHLVLNDFTIVKYVMLLERRQDAETATLTTFFGGEATP